MTTSLKKANFILLSLVLGACSMMDGNKNSSTVENVPMPPKNLSPSSDANNVIVAPPVNNATNNSSNEQQPSSNQATSSERIQEKKSYGGEVEEVKVNNINKVPAYYIYPKQSGVDTNAPSSDNVATPNWKLSW